LGGLSTAATLGFLALLYPEPARESAPVLAWKGLHWVVALGGATVALGCARDQASQDVADGVTDWVRSRGLGPTELTRARGLACLDVVVRSVLLPAFILGMTSMALAGSVGALVSRGLELGLLLSAGAFAGLTLGGLALLCARWLPNRGRSVFLLLLLGPELLRWGLPQVPSVPALLLAALGFFRSLHP
jgi:hypothetical protein